MKRAKSDNDKAALVKKPPTAAEMHPLFPLNQMNCPHCHEPFRGYERNKLSNCFECGGGFYVVQVAKDFFLLTL